MELCLHWTLPYPGCKQFHVDESTVLEEGHDRAERKAV